MPEKIIRDPVHDVITFDLARPIDALLFKLLRAAEIQRLRRIRQLGLASLAYPGADHCRYSHSLGVMQTARLMWAQLKRHHSAQIDEQSETILLIAALLHDLGHGPFSHVFERVSGINHEKLTQRLIADPQSEVNQILREHDRQLPDLLVKYLRCQPQRTFLNDMLASQLDADRFDYLLRDNLMTGSRYGDYDLNWLIHALAIDWQTNRLAVSWKGVSAAEAYIQSRYHMYRNVYFHKVVRSAEGMLRLTLQRAKRLAVQGRLPGPSREHAVYKFLMGQRLSLEEFVELDDVSVMHCFKLWAHAEDAELAGLCRGLLYRRLFKTIDLSHLPAEEAVAAFERASAEVAKAGGDATYALIYDQADNEPHELQPSAGMNIAVLRSDGKLAEFSEISPLPGALQQQLQFRRIHVAEQWKGIALRAVGN